MNDTGMVVQARRPRRIKNFNWRLNLFIVYTLLD